MDGGFNGETTVENKSDKKYRGCNILELLVPEIVDENRKKINTLPGNKCLTVS